MDEALKATRRAIDELDLGAENARVAELEAEIARINQGISTAEDRCTEISRLKADRNVSGDKVAEALLAGDTASRAADCLPSHEALEEERVALRQGIKTLNHRREDLQSEIDTIRRDAKGKVARLLAPLVEEIIAEERRAAETLRAGHAAICALNFATEHFGTERNQTAGLIEALGGPGKLLPGKRSLQVDSDLVEVLAPLRNKGPAL